MLRLPLEAGKGWKHHMQSWLFLYVAILIEVAGTISLKFSQGLTVVLPTALAFTFYTVSLSCLAVALKQIDVGTAYAMWSGLGTTAVAVIGVLYFREPANAVKVVSLLLVVVGVVGLNLSGTRH